MHAVDMFTSVKLLLMNNHFKIILSFASYSMLQYSVHLHLVPRLRMHGAIPLLPIFIVWCLVKHRICLYGVLLS